MGVHRRAARFAVQRSGFDELAAGWTLRDAHGIGGALRGLSGGFARQFRVAARTVPRASLSPGAALGANNALRFGALKPLSARFAEGPCRLNCDRATWARMELACDSSVIDKRLATPFAVVETFRKVNVASITMHRS